MARRAASASNSASSEGSLNKESSDAGEEVTRCICGNEEFVSTPRTRSLNASPGLYVQCERCNVWQHGFCMGFMAERDVPNEYYCEKCEPGFHRISHRHGMLLSKYEPTKAAADEARDEPTVEPPADAEAKPQNGVSPTHSPGTNGAQMDEGKAADAKPRSSARSSAAEPAPAQVDPTTNGKASKAVKAEKASANDEGDLESGLKSEPAKPESPAKDRSPETGSAPPDIKDENGSNGDSRSDDNHESSGPPSEAKSNPSSAHETPADNKKRSRRNGPDPDSTNGSRNRKWRSREDEILQRVLEESAREAREAEARRRSLEGLPPLDPEERREESRPENINEDENADDLDGRPARSSRTRPSSSLGDAPRKEPPRNGAASRPSRGGRPPRGGRRNGTRSTSNGSAGESASPRSQATSKRTTNGVKKCKPRIPSQRSTFDEMRRRVASILEFSSRTQAELANEKETGLKMLEQTAQDGHFGKSFKDLSGLSDRNRESLESLTEKLLRWEEQYGLKDSP